MEDEKNNNLNNKVSLLAILDCILTNFKNVLNSNKYNLFTYKCA